MRQLDPAASFEPTYSCRGAVLSKRPHFYALICVIGQWPEIQIDIVNRITLILKIMMWDFSRVPRSLLGSFGNNSSRRSRNCSELRGTEVLTSSLRRALIGSGKVR